jgi:UDP-N-acetylglucosamine transferase subunit ALG13
MDYAVVTPARNEAASLPRLARALVEQTLPPAAWIVADDGSTDATPAIVSELMREHSWIALERVEPDARPLSRGRRQGRCLLTLQRGVAALPVPPDLLVKIDADVSFAPDYFERLVAAFAADPRLGLASGVRRERERGRWVVRHVSGTSVEAQCRTYRWQCWLDVLPLEPRMGWDGIDEAKAVLRGWRTHVIGDLSFDHHRSIGERDGARFRARLAEGEAAHYMGYRPSYLLLRALWHGRREPAALGLLAGYAQAAVSGRSRCPDADARGYVRRQQAARRLGARLREARGRSVRPNLGRADLLLVCSPGGHLMDLAALREVWQDHSRIWVSLDRAGVRSLLADEQVLFAHGPTSRNVPNLLRNTVVAWRTVSAVRPRAVLTSGAGVAVPFAWVARLHGARVVYVECAGRVDGRSLSGRFIGPIASHVFVQWPEQVERWRKARYAGNVLELPHEVPATADADAGGTFVTVGADDTPFDRLLHAVRELGSAPEPLVVQRGPSQVETPGATCVDFMSFGDLCRNVRDAQIVITHGGVGSIAVALRHGKRPIVVPRRRRFGEAVDDHQVAFARRLHAAGLVVLAAGPDELAGVVAAHRPWRAAPPRASGQDLARALRVALAVP